MSEFFNGVMGPHLVKDLGSNYSTVRSPLAAQDSTYTIIVIKDLST